MIYNGNPHITTARHCIPYNNNSGYGWYSHSGSGRQGQTVYTSNYGAVNVLAGMGGAWAYDGAWNDTAGYAKPVHDEATPGIGHNVCTGGGNSGEHCQATIIKTGVSLYEPETGLTVSTVEAMVDSGISVAAGDSGGPVIVPITSGTYKGQVHAVGFIQGEHNGSTSACGSQSLAVSTGATCSDTVLFSYVSTVTNHSSLILDTY